MDPVKGIMTSPVVRIFLTFTIFTFLLALLPNTPFMVYLLEIKKLPYLGYINWLIPFQRCAVVMAVWWTCVVVYYAISWILRQAGIIGR